MDTENPSRMHALALPNCSLLRTFDGIAFEGAAVGQSRKRAHPTSPASAGRYGPDWTGLIFFSDNTKNKRIEYIQAALPLVAAVPKDYAGVVRQAADIVADFGFLNRCVQRRAYSMRVSRRMQRHGAEQS
jgi:hypothetical protein